MDKASDYESGDSRFESWQGRFLFSFTVHSNCARDAHVANHACNTDFLQAARGF